MSAAFVWFHNGSKNTNKSVAFYEKLLDWKRTDGPPGMTMFAGDAGPFAAVGDAEAATGWIPFVDIGDPQRRAARREGAAEEDPRASGGVLHRA